MTDRDRIEFLQGQVQCLIALSFALIETHQDKKRLRAFVDANLEGVSAKLGGEPVQEAMLEGIEDMKARLLKFVSSSSERK
jgi:hypothetical protein